MKKTIITVLTAFTVLSVSGQVIVGTWNGILKVQGSQLRVVLHIAKTDSGYTSTMDSPDQGAAGIAVTKTSFENSTLKIEVANAGIKYQGVLNKNHVLEGTFKQYGMSLLLNLSKGEIKKKKRIRPQEPKKPYPYLSENVSFENKEEQIFLAGTLSLPQKNGVFPAVVLISGSGPQDRNEAPLFGHKPFLVISDYLTRNGIAVLRFDDRGTGDSKGNFKDATSLDFSTDVKAAVQYLKTRKEIDKTKIGLIGHSEGGMIAPMLASRYKDIAFVVLLAGPTIPIDELLLLQSQKIGKASGVSENALKDNDDINRDVFEIIKKSTDLNRLKTDLTNYFKRTLKENKDFKVPQGMTEQTFLNGEVLRVATPWMSYFIKYDPAFNLAKLKCPILALYGEKDLQVPPEENLKALKKIMAKAGNNNFQTKVFPNLNHLFQECKTGLPSEYGTIEQTFSPKVLKQIAKWIQDQTR